MTWKEINRPVIEGGLNKNQFVTGTDEAIFLRRVPKRGLETMQEIKEEYEGVGFTATGGKFYRRTPLQQYEFTRMTAAKGLRVLPPHTLEDEVLYYPFVEAAGYKEVLKSEMREIALGQVFGDLQNAHTQGIIYGDRWSPNILFSPERGIVHIDFDIEIDGQFAREFEIAQAVYYSVMEGGDEVAVWMLDFFANRELWFDKQIVYQFMEGHAKYFIGTPYGGAEEQIETIISLGM